MPFDANEAKVFLCDAMRRVGEITEPTLLGWRGYHAMDALKQLDIHPGKIMEIVDGMGVSSSRCTISKALMFPYVAAITMSPRALLYFLGSDNAIMYGETINVSTIRNVIDFTTIQTRLIITCFLLDLYVQGVTPDETLSKSYTAAKAFIRDCFKLTTFNKLKHGRRYVLDGYDAIAVDVIVNMMNRVHGNHLGYVRMNHLNDKNDDTARRLIGESLRLYGVMSTVIDVVAPRVVDGDKPCAMYTSPY